MAKKKAFVIVSIYLLLLMPCVALAGGKISLKLQGGLAYLQAGDVNAGTQAFFDWGKVFFAPPPGGLIQGGYTAIHWGYDFGGDIIFELSPKVGIGVGFGYLERSMNPPNHQGMMMITDNPQGVGLVRRFDARTKLSAIPLRLGLFLTLPINEKFNFTANAGVSYYLKARYQAFWIIGEDSPNPEAPFQALSTTTDKNKAPIGFQGGLGVEYKLLAKAAVFVEAQGRYARFRGLEGTSVWEAGFFEGWFPPFSESGKLFFESVPAIPNAPRLIMVQNAPPAGPGGQPREAVVDFSGISLQAGVRIHF